MKKCIISFFKRQVFGLLATTFLLLPVMSFAQTKFVAYGDTRGNRSTAQNIIGRIAVEQPAFVIHSGDLWDGYGGDEIQKWVDDVMSNPYCASLQQQQRFLVARGNHETQSEMNSMSSSFILNGQFKYSFRAGNVFVVCTEMSPDPAFLEVELKKPEAQSAAYRVVFHHYPVYSTGNYSYSGNAAFEAICDKYDVTMTFCGHDHNYHRTRVMFGGSPVYSGTDVPSTIKGTTYIVTGGGGAPLYSASTKSFTDKVINANHYCVINAYSDRLEMQVKSPNGTILETFIRRNVPPVQYTLTTNTAGQGSVSLNPSGGTYAEGTVVALTATPAVGWKFDGWSGAATGTQNPVNVTMSANKTVTATFSAIPNYTLTTNTVGQGSVALNPTGGTYAEGTIVALTATPALGWKFDGWSGAATGTQNPVNVTMDANKTVTATFSAIPTYTLTTNTVGQGSVSLNPAGGTYNENTVVTLTATPALGYKFDGWSGAATGTQNSVTVTMNANKTVTATFSAIPTYTLTTNTVGQGTVSLNPAGGTYNENTVVALTATPTAGYKFDGWSGAATGTQNPVNVTMNANKTVTATFSALPSYTLTTTVVGTGTISLSPSGGSYVQGTVVSVTANAGTGYQFNGWSGDLSGTANPTSITMDANKTVTANFGLIPTEVILTQNTSGGDKMEVNEGQRGAQSFKYASSDYKISKVVVYLSRDQEAPTGNLHFSIGTGVNTGAVSGSTVNITPSQVTNTSEGSSFTAHEIVYSSPVGPFNAGTTYYLNMENDAPNGKKYYFEFDPDNNYSNGSYFKELSDEEKDMRFQIWGSSTGYKAAGYEDSMTDLRLYPNPAKDQVIIENNSQKSKTVEFRNISGVLLKTVKLTDGKTTVDISDLKQGFYLISTIGTSSKPIRLTIE